MATWFHVPCPSCGSARAVNSVLHGSFDPHMNPVGLLVAPLLLLLGLRAVWLISTDGNVLALAEGRFGTVLRKAAVTLLILEVVLWILRFLGFFGGPVPV